MLCDNCLNQMVDKLREDDIAVLQYLYNENILLPQVARHKLVIANNLKLSEFRTVQALFRLECYDMVQLQTWSKASNYFITQTGIKALTILSQKMEG